MGSQDHKQTEITQVLFHKLTIEPKSRAVSMQFNLLGKDSSSPTFFIDPYVEVSLSEVDKVSLPWAPQDVPMPTVEMPASDCKYMLSFSIVELPANQSMVFAAISDADSEEKLKDLTSFSLANLLERSMKFADQYLGQLGMPSFSDLSMGHTDDPGVQQSMEKGFSTALEAELGDHISATPEFYQQLSHVIAPMLTQKFVAMKLGKTDPVANEDMRPRVEEAPAKRARAPKL